MQGEKLTKALEWFNRAAKMEAEGKLTMMERSLEQMVKLEKEGLAAGESWD